MIKDPQFEIKRKQGGPAAMMMTAPGMNHAEGDEAENDKPASTIGPSTNWRFGLYLWVL
jgi:hypothetical protein